MTEHQVEQGFSLFAIPFAITYTDDDGEVTDIWTDSDLTEAIRYFSPVHEERPVSSSSSILSGPSITRGKITLRVRISVEYDGPSLSDTSSLVSLEEYNNRNSSELSLSLSAAPKAEPDDDSVTVSSKDMGSKYDVYRGNGPKTVVMTQSREPLISKSPQPSTHASQWENGSAACFSPPEIDQRASGSQAGPLVQELDPFADDRSKQGSSLVLERLKLEDGQQATSSYGSYTLHSDRGAAWIRDQNARTIKSMLGDLPSPSEASFDHHAPDQADRRSVLSGELALHQDPSGKYYYAYTVGSSYASSHDSGDETASDVHRSSVQVEPAQSRPTSMDVHDVAPDVPSPSGSDLRRSSTSVSTSSANPFADPRPSADAYPLDYIHPDVPPEVLKFITSIPPAPPRDPPTCSNCTIILDAIRYVCSTCGEKRLVSPSESPTSSRKGKDRAVDFVAHSPNSVHVYPPSPRSNSYPTPPSSSPSNSTLSVLSDYSHHPSRSLSDSTINAHTSGNGARRPSKPLPAIPISPTANSSSTMVPQMMVNGHMHGNGHGPYAREDTAIIGYELCWECLPSAGVTHALEMSVAPGSSPVHAKWSTSGEDALSQWRRTAPSQKGQLRHAYVEKSWGHGGWQDVGELCVSR